MNPVISVDRLSKKYSLGIAKSGNSTLRDDLTAFTKSASARLRHPFQKFQTRSRPTEEFWALRDVGFDIAQGDRVGIIGRNGAGKSTLLKILSRITEPTEGRIRIKGRVASLLEVGTGFHPELTGRENIFLNGAILGMSRMEISRKFDEIVAFAEVERFLDTPVKRYSSGMYVRLAFAVAAHLEPEILIVDEVLAVGDAQFQKKCLGRMQEVGREGRTVIFVSHNMSAVAQLCTSALLFQSGKLIDQSNDVRKLITSHLNTDEQGSQFADWNGPDPTFSSEWFTPSRLAVTDAHGVALKLPISNDADAWIHVEGTILTLDPALQVGYAVFNNEGSCIYITSHTDCAESDWPEPKLGKNRFRSKFPARLLNEGNYRIELLAALYFRTWINEPGAKTPFISLRIHGGCSDSPYWTGRRPGEIAPVLAWELQ